MKSTLLASLTIVFLVSCGSKKQGKAYIEHKGYAVGTSYIIEYEGNSGNLNAEIDQLLQELDAAISTSNPNSLITKLNSNDSGGTSNKHVLSLFNLSEKIYKETNGAFDPTIQSVVDWWGRDMRKYTFPELVDSNTIDSLKSLTGFSAIQNNQGVISKKRSSVQLNFAGIYEGYTCDMIAQLLDAYNVINYRVEIGGKVRARGNNRMNKPWEVGLDEPTTNPKVRNLMAIAQLNNKGFAISGSYRDYFTKGVMKLPYTIDPATVYPVKHTLISATVFASNATEAQAYSNAFMVMGVEKTKLFLKTHPQIEVYLVSTNYKGEWITYLSDGLSNQVEYVKEGVR